MNNNSIGKPIYGFYEEEYPIYSDEWTNELQSPVTAKEVNGLVDRIKLLEKIVYEVLLDDLDEPQPKKNCNWCCGLGFVRSSIDPRQEECPCKYEE